MASEHACVRFYQSLSINKCYTELRKEYLFQFFKLYTCYTWVPKVHLNLINTESDSFSNQMKLNVHRHYFVDHRTEEVLNFDTKLQSRQFPDG